MDTNKCTYPGDREAVIVSYLYGEIDAAEREAFASHLAGCARCREELSGMDALRARLSQWVAPEPRRGPVVGRFGQEAPRPGRSPLSLGRAPAWAQVAAAVLVLGIALGAANLRVTSDAGGFAISTGWLGDPASIRQPEAPSIEAPAAPAPWQADLLALEQQLRADLRPAAAAAAAPSEAELLRRVRALIDESESRQQREFALRLAESFQEVQSQRYADLRRIEHTLGLLESSSRAYLTRQGQAINDLAVRVSQGR